MLRKSVTIGGIVLAFLFGFFLGGQKHVVIGNKVIGIPDAGVEKKAYKQDFDSAKEKIEFQNTITPLRAGVNTIESKLIELIRLANYFDHKAKNGEAESLEASLVYEGQYRNSLINILNAQKESCEIYKKIIQVYEGHVVFLEKIDSN
ncbi:MAG: hypothetical protein WCG73_02610 [Candidatus Moraniibacteriota bacterium]